MGDKPRVLIVDDKLEMAEMVSDGLEDRGFEAVALGSSKEAVQRLEAEEFDALVTDLRMPELDGLELLAASKALKPERPVLVMTAFGAVDSAIAAIREGAYQYLTKPFKVEELAVFLQRALDEAAIRVEAAALKSELGARYSAKSIVAESEGMKRVLEVVQRTARTSATMLLLGETGTGKGHLAHAIHVMSPRAGRRFVTVNCAALPEPLLESELFGHAKGAFTGATSRHAGLFVEADGGTLFLDEVGEMSPGLQAKLLHVLESGRVRAVGAGDERAVDVRVIAATHRDLRMQADKGLFREDLLYRLEVVAVEIPPLRQRREDVPVLLNHYLAVAKERHQASPVKSISGKALVHLMDYDWPGNVRELAHMVERLVLLGNGPEIQPEDLPPLVMHGLPHGAVGGLAGSTPRPRPVERPVRKHLGFVGEIVPVRELHHLYASWVVEKTSGNRTQAASLLDIDLKTLRKWLNDPGADGAAPQEAQER